MSYGRKIFLRHTIERFNHLCREGMLSDARDIIVREKLISKVPDTNGVMFNKLIHSFDLMEFKNKQLWDNISKIFIYKIENLTIGMFNMTSLVTLLSNRCPDIVNVRKIEEIMVSTTDIDHFSIIHINLIPFLSMKDGNNTEFWSLLEKRILVLMNKPYPTTAIRDSIFNNAVWYFSEIKQGSPYYWDSVQRFASPYLSVMSTEYYSRIGYGIVKTQFLTLQFKKEYLRAFALKVTDSSVIAQDHSMMAFTLSCIEGGEKIKHIATLISAVCTNNYNPDYNPLRTTVELLTSVRLEEKTKKLISDTFIEYYNETPWKELENSTYNIHLIALNNKDIELGKKNIILENIKKDGVYSQLAYNVYQYPEIYNVVNELLDDNIFQWNQTMEKQLMTNYNDSKANLWSLNILLRLLSLLELGESNNASSNYYQMIGQELDNLCKSDNIAVEFDRSQEKNYVSSWKSTYLTMLFAISLDKLSLHHYMSLLRRRYQTYSYQRVKDEVLNLLLLIHMRHSNKHEKIKDCGRNVLMRFNPTYRLELYYIMDPTNDFLNPIKTKYKNQSDLNSILNELYKQPDVSEFTPISIDDSIDSKTIPTLDIENIVRDSQQSKFNKDTGRINSIHHASSFNDMSHLFGLDDNNDVDDIIYNKSKENSEYMHKESDEHK